MYTAIYHSATGTIALESDGTSLCAVHFVDTVEEIIQSDKLPTVLHHTIRWLDGYFSREIPDFTPPLNPKGTPFQKTVWSVIARIPYGQTMTYGEIAEIIARDMGVLKMSAQAVGAACKRNPIPLLIPCHRVVGANGALVGYNGGIVRKMKLLRLERILE